jgi:hypothetical protein
MYPKDGKSVRVIMVIATSARPCMVNA